MEFITINRGYKIVLYPNEVQKVLFNKTFGCTRFIYNKMLHDKDEYYKKFGKSLDVAPATYKKDFPWLKEVDSLALCNAQQNLIKAYSGFFKGNTKFPKYKSKKNCKNSYTTNNQNNSIRIVGDTIKLPKIGFVKCRSHREFPKDAVIKSVTIKLHANGKYTCSVLLEYQIPKAVPSTIEESLALGLDYSSPSVYVDSNKQTPKNAHWYRKSQIQLAKEQRKLSRMTKGSNNYLIQKRKIANLHEHISNQRLDFCHQQSRKIANSYNVVAVEDIDLKALSQTLNFGKNTHDNGFGLLRTLLQYKLEEQGKYFVKVGRWFPSTKQCGTCGYKKTDLTLKDREWDCPNCGTHHHRDENAANNIKKEGLRILTEKAVA